MSCVLLRHAQGNVLFATDLFLKSLDEIAKLEASGAKVICGHDSEQWDSLQKGRTPVREACLQGRARGIWCA